jgi:hypothetical protein
MTNIPVIGSRSVANGANSKRGDDPEQADSSGRGRENIRKGPGLFEMSRMTPPYVTVPPHKAPDTSRSQLRDDHSIRVVYSSRSLQPVFKAGRKMDKGDGITEHAFNARDRKLVVNNPTTITASSGSERRLSHSVPPFDGGRRFSKAS